MCYAAAISESFDLRPRRFRSIGTNPFYSDKIISIIYKYGRSCRFPVRQSEGSTFTYDCTFYYGRRRETVRSGNFPNSISVCYWLCCIWFIVIKNNASACRTNVINDCFCTCIQNYFIGSCLWYSIVVWASSIGFCSTHQRYNCARSLRNSTTTSYQFRYNSDSYFCTR